MGTLKELFMRNLRQLRELRGFSQEELADKSGVSLTFIAHLETGRKSPSFETLELIGKALNVPVFRLLMPPLAVDETEIENATEGLREIVKKMFVVIDSSARELPGE
jgi:transcriptional regulator with XRE-family HTH domain